MATKHISDAQVLLAYAMCCTDRDALRIQFPAFHSGQSVFPYDLLQLWTGEPFKVCWRAMERALGRDLVEYGVNLRSGWPTEKGVALLRQHLASSGIEVDDRGRLSQARRAA